MCYKGTTSRIRGIGVHPPVFIRFASDSIIVIFSEANYYGFLYIITTHMAINKRVIYNF